MQTPINNSQSHSSNAPTVALWTPHGRGAVATVKVCGDFTAVFHCSPSIPFRAVNGKQLADQPIDRIVFGHWGQEPSEEVVVCRTSQRELEIHCHGGVSAARRIMDDWCALNVQVVDWSDQLRQAEGDLTADCRWALSRVTTLRTAGILLEQEAAWLRFAEQVKSAATTEDRIQLQADIQGILQWSKFGRHLLEPYRVVLTGPPNVGKSALLNALIGYERSVVFDQPGTTRDIVTAETAIAGWPVRLTDTAGLRDDAVGLEAAGIQLARQELSAADLVIQVWDVSVPIQVEALVNTLPDPNIIHVANKIDLAPEFEATPAAGCTIFPVSAMTRQGLDLLITAIGDRLVSQIPKGGTPIPFLDRQVEWLNELLAE